MYSYLYNRTIYGTIKNKVRQEERKREEEEQENKEEEDMTVQQSTFQ